MWRVLFWVSIAFLLLLLVGSRLSRIQNGVFHETGQVEIVIRASIETLGERFFSECKSLLSVIFKSRLRLLRIESWAFRRTGLIQIIIRTSIDFMDEDCFVHSWLLFSVALGPVLKFWVGAASLIADHSHQWDFTQSRDCHELKVGIPGKSARIALSGKDTTKTKQSVVQF
jgi:hypothetical protein